MTYPALKTDFCRLVGIEKPIVQTGMGWVSGVELTAATSEAGGLGILAAATLSMAEMETAVDALLAKTSKPFGVNLRSDTPDAMERIEVLIERKVRLVSFAAAPKEAHVQRLKEAGVLVMPTVGAPRHAEKVAAWGVDAVIAQGHEGGGHTGRIPTSILLPQVVGAVDIPVLAAGGFKDGRGLVAALAWGASGIAMGTRFLMTQESLASAPIQDRYLQASVTDTLVTRAIDGHPQRVLNTSFVRGLESAGPLRRLLITLRAAWAFKKLTGNSIWSLLKAGISMRGRHGLTMSQVMMAANAPMLTKATMADGQTEVGIMPTGQICGAIDHVPTVAQLLAQISQEAEDVLNTFAREGSPP